MGFNSAFKGLISYFNPQSTFSSIVYLFESSTCLEQLCVYPQEDNCMNKTSGIITLC